MTGETEVACYIFLATETKENVEDGLKAWKSVIPYTEEDVGGRFHIYIDKDFEYKRILEKTFTCIVLLCSIHIFRYWTKYSHRPEVMKTINKLLWTGK